MASQTTRDAQMRADLFHLVNRLSRKDVATAFATAARIWAEEVEYANETFPVAFVIGYLTGCETARERDRKSGEAR